jgi:site-specific DNA-methyltransferase (adenine-specific)
MDIMGGAIKKLTIPYSGFNGSEGKIHPTQKPVKLYKKCLINYAKPEFKIIDTHLGSGSSAIAAYDFGIAEFVGCEIDKEYFDAAVKRFEIYKMQQTIKFLK